MEQISWYFVIKLFTNVPGTHMHVIPTLCICMQITCSLHRSLIKLCQVIKSHVCRNSFFVMATSRFGSPWNNYIDEFSTNVWAVVVVFLLSGSFCLGVIIRRSPGETLQWTLGETLFKVFGMFSGQGAENN